ncbi:MAG: helix-turn-helix transcriptional regulator, partial [Planctomycetes bacterium]|nr:helix-turn-helix transcriptional regulator [Planctomycetota bacterium]
GKIPQQLRETIARNIRACRVKKFPGRGGGKRCALAFGVSPQQWSPWERGMRTPDELRLSEIAAFFGVTVEELRRDSCCQPPPSSPSPSPSPSIPPTSGGERQPPFNVYPNPYAYLVPGMPPLDPPGSPASFYWLARHFIHYLMTEGISVTLDEKTIARLAGKGDNSRQP